MSYYNDLSYELRQRGLTEGRIADIIEEAEQHCSISDEKPEDAFGKPRDYASNFPVTGRPRTSRGLMNIGGLIVVVIFAIQVIGLSQGNDMRWGPIPFFALGLPVLLAFIVAAFFKSRRIPQKRSLL